MVQPCVLIHRFVYCRIQFRESNGSKMPVTFTVKYLGDYVHVGMIPNYCLPEY